MRAWQRACLPLVFTAACATGKRDPFAAAERALLGNDLLGALLAYDSVPVSHARYPDARTAAVGVEGRMRRCHELLLQALMLRAEWCDAEALAVLRQARDVWPALPLVDGLIVATENRIRLFGKNDVQPDPELPRATVVPLLQLVAPSDPVPSDPAQSDPARTAATTPSRARLADPVARAEPSAPPQGTSSLAVVEPASDGAHAGESIVSSSIDPVAPGLVQVESRLGRGELEPAVTDLLNLVRRYPKDPRVQVRLARLLHQRALLRYGQGAVTAAIADWELVVAIDPSNHLARNLLEVARAEDRPAVPR